MITAKDILLKLNLKMGDYAADMIAYNEDIKKANPWSQEYRELADKYNDAVSKMNFIQEFLDEIEESED